MVKTTDDLAENESANGKISGWDGNQFSSKGWYLLMETQDGHALNRPDRDL